MVDIAGLKSYTSFRQLGGGEVSVDEVIGEIGNLPLDGILKFLALITIRGVQRGNDFFDPRCQGEYLNYALVDSFPRKIPNAWRMYTPGRVPITGGKQLFVHEHNINWLTHNAILHANDVTQINTLDNSLRCRISRLLLIINDFIGEGTRPSIASLAERRKSVMPFLRLWQFNGYFQPFEQTMHMLARQKVLFLDLLPRYYDVETCFQEAMSGVSLQEYFEIYSLFVSHFVFGMGDGKCWLSKTNFSSALPVGGEKIETVLKRWIRTPDEYREEYLRWQVERQPTDLSHLYDFVILYETPIIEACPDQLVCPVIPLLFKKIVDEPFFIVTDHLRLDTTRRRDFQKAIGMAYEEYAHSLIERIAISDSAGKWHIWKSPSSESGNREYADTYIQRGDVGVSFEHKGGRLTTDFLRGKDDDRIIGPPEEILQKLDSGNTVTISEAMKADHSILTRGMWQQSSAGPRLVSWAQQMTGTTPSRIVAVITHLAGVKVDPLLRVGYLNPLRAKASLYDAPYWSSVQWVDVETLEALAALAETGKLDLDALLLEKEAGAPDDRFDLYLISRIGSLYGDKKLHEIADEMLRKAGVDFFAYDHDVDTVVCAPE